MRNQIGYTAIELITAAGIAALLVMIAVPVYRNYMGSAQDAALVAHIAELEEPLATYTGVQDPIAICQDYKSLLQLPTLDNNDVSLQLTFSPLNEQDLSLGYRASVVVSADATQEIQVAKDVHRMMAQRQRVAKGAVLTESFVAFEVFLTSQNDAFCTAMSTNPTASTAGSGTSTTPASVIPGVSAPQISFSFTTQQDVVEFGASGTGSVINNGPLNTGGDLKELAVEFNIIGGHQVRTRGSHGATFLSYAHPGDTNEFYVWNPLNLTVRIHGAEYPTGIDTTVDGQTHRYTVLWSSTTGRVQVLVDGEPKFSRDGVGQGYAIPGGGVLALAQDQDQYHLEDGTHGGDHGFSPEDAFHGQIFSAALANHIPDAAKLKDAPLASVLEPSTGLVADIRMSGGTATDLTGNHQLTVHGDVIRKTVSVDTSVAIPNPGAILSLQVQATPTNGDTLLGLKLVGLLPGTVVTDSAGHTGSGGSIDVLGWDLSSISAKLPDNVVTNMNIGIIATAKGRRGDIATAAQYQPLVLAPDLPIPPKPT